MGRGPLRAGVLPSRARAAVTAVEGAPLSESLQSIRGERGGGQEWAQGPLRARRRRESPAKSRTDAARRSLAAGNMAPLRTGGALPVCYARRPPFNNSTVGAGRAPYCGAPDQLWYPRFARSAELLRAVEPAARDPFPHRAGGRNKSRSTAHGSEITYLWSRQDCGCRS